MYISIQQISKHSVHTCQGTYPRYIYVVHCKHTFIFQEHSLNSPFHSGKTGFLGSYFGALGGSFAFDTVGFSWACLIEASLIAAVVSSLFTMYVGTSQHCLKIPYEGSTVMAPF